LWQHLSCVITAGNELENFVLGLEIADKKVEDEALRILTAENVNVEQLFSSISDADLQNMGVPELVRELISSAVQAFICPASPIAPPSEVF
jgi:hypothetical protein